MANFKLIPNLNLFFPCEDASVNVSHTTGDLQYGWWEIRKPLYHVHMPAGITKGFGTPELCVYYQLSNGAGDYNLLVEFYQLDLAEPKKTKKLMWSEPITVHCENELAVIEDIVVLKKVPFPKPGQYQFVMKESGQVLPGGECYLRVFAGEPQ